MVDFWPLTAAQQGVWLGQQLAPESPQFNIAEYVDISGPVEISVLVACIEAAVAEASALHVRFVETGQVRTAVTAEVAVIDLLDEADPVAAARSWMLRDVATPRSLTGGDLFAHRVFRVGDRRILWYHRAHHILLDGYGMALLTGRVAELYRAAVDGLPTPPSTFGDWSAVIAADRAYAASADRERDRAFWLDQFADRPAPVTLSGAARATAPASPVRANAVLPPDIVAGLHTTAPAARANWTEVLIAAVAGYLHRMTGAAQVCLALPVMLRTGTPALRVPCMTLNGIPLWIEFGDDPALVDVTARVARQLVRGRRHHRYRAEDLRRDLGLVGTDRAMYGPSVNLMLFDYDLRIPRCDSVVHNISAGMIDDLVFNLYDRADGADPMLYLDGHPAVYSSETLNTHLRRFLHFLRAVLELPGVPVRDADVLLPGERETLRAWETGLVRNWPERNLRDLFVESIDRAPQASAGVEDANTPNPHNGSRGGSADSRTTRALASAAISPVVVPDTTWAEQDSRTGCRDGVGQVSRLPGPVGGNAAVLAFASGDSAWAERDCRTGSRGGVGQVSRRPDPAGGNAAGVLAFAGGDSAPVAKPVDAGGVRPLGTSARGTGAPDVARRGLLLGDLGSRIVAIAGVLEEFGARPGHVVGVLLPRTADAIAAVFAVLERGAAYLPLDPGQPDARLAALLDGIELGELGLAALITTAAMSSRIPDRFGDRLIVLDHLDEGSSPKRTPRIRSDDVAWLVHTSGTTGTPKAVAISHASVVNLFHHHRATMIEPAERGRRMRAALTASLSFDTAWEGLFWLLAGHELHLIDDDLRRDPERLVEYIRRERIDFLDITPTFARELLNAGLFDGPHRPGIVALGGEAADPELWRALGAEAEVVAYNLYGPTECTVDATWCPLPDRPEPSIGTPVTNGRCHVLDRRMRRVPAGVVGELYIGGAPVGLGYHGDRVSTATRYVADPFGTPGTRLYRTGDLVRWHPDGHLEYLGRGDDQISLRGYRIEAAEVAGALTTHPVVDAAAVRIHDEILVGYVVAASGADRPEPAELRVHAAERLPDYMVPSAFVFLDRLPHNANGKLDRAALAPPPASATGSRPARTETERTVAGLFAAALDRAEVGIDDDFFALGGHSLRAARVLTGIRENFGVRWDLRVLFDTPTVAGLAARLATGAESESSRAGTDLESEVLLDEAIRPVAAPGRPRTVLLTGATGFLGSFLLDELLRSTELSIHCLVRADNDAAALDRIRAARREYGLGTIEFESRVTAVAGDLAQPRLGLPAERFLKLADDVDVILHNGARVHHFEPYTRLRPANVQGTEWILRLATTGIGKSVHFVSSADTAYAVSGNPPILREDHRAPANAVPLNGYIASKWVSEGLVLAAGERGIPVAVYRPGRIGGHSDTGVIGSDDAFWSLIRAMVLSGSVPAEMADTATIDLAPVDWVAAAIVRLIFEKPGRTYHLTSQNKVQFAELIRLLDAEDIPLHPEPLSDWLTRLRELAEISGDRGDHTPAIALAHAAHLTAPVDPVRYARDNTMAALADASIAQPDPRSALAATISHLLRTGFLPVPAQPRRGRR